MTNRERLILVGALWTLLTLLAAPWASAQTPYVRAVRNTNTTPEVLIITDDILLVDATTVPITVSLPTATLSLNQAGSRGRHYTIKKTDSLANAVTIPAVTSPQQTIDGQVSYSLVKQYQEVRVVSDGSNWNVLDSLLKTGLEAHIFPGANAGEKIAACLTALPSTGGTCDARGLEGAQTIAADVFMGVSKPVEIIWGAGTYTLSVNMTIPANFTMNFFNGGTWLVPLGSPPGIVITFNGALKAPQQQIFSFPTPAGPQVTGKISFGANSKVEAMSPVWWGAKADGVTDDSAALQNAINAACQNVLPAFNAPGTPAGTVFIPPNFVMLTSAPIVVPKHCTGMRIVGSNYTFFEGTGPSFSGIKVKSGLTAFDALQVDGIHTELYNFGIECQDIVTGSCRNGIVVRGANHGLIHRIFVGHATGDGIIVNPNPSYKAVNISTISRNGNVVSVTTSGAHELDLPGGNPLVSIVGVSVTSFNGLFVLSTVPSSTTFTYAQSGANESGSGGTANWHGNSNVLIIRDSSIQNNGRHGIDVAPGGHDINSMRLIHNNLQNNSGHGVDIEAGSGIHVMGGLYEANSGAGIKISEQTGAVTTTIAAAITGSTTAQTVTPASIPNIYTGSTLIINSGLSDQEYVIPQCSNNVPAGFCAADTFKGIFRLNHAANSTVAAVTSGGVFVAYNYVTEIQDYEGNGVNCLLDGGTSSANMIVVNDVLVPFCKSADSQLPKPFNLVMEAQLANGGNSGALALLDQTGTGFLYPWAFQPRGIPFTQLSSVAANGFFVLCSDCSRPTAVNQVCTSASPFPGAFAMRLNGSWICY